MFHVKPFLLRKLEGFQILCHVMEGEREREREEECFLHARDSHPIFVCHQDLEGQEMLLDRMQK
jgi:hypothetical protein